MSGKPRGRDLVRFNKATAYPVLDRLKPTDGRTTTIVAKLHLADLKAILGNRAIVVHAALATTTEVTIRPRGDIAITTMVIDPAKDVMKMTITVDQTTILMMKMTGIPTAIATDLENVASENMVERETAKKTARVNEMSVRTTVAGQISQEVQKAMSGGAVQAILPMIQSEGHPLNERRISMMSLELPVISTVN